LSSEVREHLVELIDFGEIGRWSRFEAFRTAGPRPWPRAAAASMLALESIARFESTEMYPAWSPDDRWLAHASNATGGYEIYVQPCPRLGTAIPVSTNGGVAPAWNPQGNELFYVEGRRGLYVMDDQRMMSVDMTNPAAAARPVVLFSFSPRGLPFAFGSHLCLFSRAEWPGVLHAADAASPTHTRHADSPGLQLV